jgi:succinate dehydrogenase / fumarate reductase cytochrome b subunit
MTEAARGASAAGARPRFRNIDVGQILQYRLPPAGIVSILHRVSGALLFLVGLPFVLYCLQISLGNDASFAKFRALASNPFIKLVFLGLIWGYLHHFCAGIRYLLLDLHVGTEKDQARTSSYAVLAVSLALTLIFALKLFGAF